MRGRPVYGRLWRNRWSANAMCRHHLRFWPFRHSDRITRQVSIHKGTGEVLPEADVDVRCPPQRTEPFRTAQRARQHRARIAASHEGLARRQVAQPYGCCDKIVNNFGCRNAAAPAVDDVSDVLSGWRERLMACPQDVSDLDRGGGAPGCANSTPGSQEPGRTHRPQPNSAMPLR